jgi:predicted RNA polymerase sigma factor
MVALNRIVALAMVAGPTSALEELAAEGAADPVVAAHHRVEAVRAHLLEMLGDLRPAQAAYREAARRTLSVPEQRYLAERADRLEADPRADGRLSS